MEGAKSAKWFQLITLVLLGALAVEVVFLVMQNRELKRALRSISPLADVEPLKAGDKVEKIELRSMEGKTLNLDFSEPTESYLLFVLSPTCPHCAKTMTTWNQLAKENTKGIYFVAGISITDADVTTTFLESNNVGFMVFSADSSFTRRYRIIGVPETILLDGKGVVKNIWIGELSPGQMAEIQDLMGVRRAPTN